MESSLIPLQEFNLEETKQITGSNGDADRERVKAIAISMMLRAFKELEPIEQLENLQLLLSSESFSRATDGLLAARHLQSGLAELCEHFKDTTVLELFQKPHLSVTNAVNEAQAAYTKLKALHDV